MEIKCPNCGHLFTLHDVRDEYAQFGWYSLRIGSLYHCPCCNDDYPCGYYGELLDVEGTVDE